MNAIIMAAGTGTRLMPLTADRPKGLIEIEGTPIIERQIRFFRQAGVEKITIVTGHRADRFGDLASRHPDLAFVHNDKFDVWNNIYSMYLVRDRLVESYVAEADVWMHRNYILPRPGRSLIFGGPRSGFAREWIIRFDEGDRRIRRIDVQGGEGIIEAGLSYWTAADAAVVRSRIEEMIAAPGFEQLYWDDVFMSLFGRIEVYLQQIDPDDWTEIDSAADLEEARRKERERLRLRFP